MKRKFLVFGLLAASSFYTFGQRTDSSYSKKKLSKTTIQVVYSHYLQDGNHSAVTGGTGTEHLIVYSPNITLRKEKDSLNSYYFDGGVDIITSASTDNIDYVVSSASRSDFHLYLTGGYNKGIKNKNVTLGAKGYFSYESDYLSLGAGFSASHTSADKSRELSAEFEAFFDDLRWGLINEEDGPKLVYPEELRNRKWFDDYRRQSFNLNLSWQQTINKRMVLAIFPGISFQHGLLATPFHRAYFKDSSARVENLPGSRIKIPIGIQLNTFIGDRYILRNYYRFYWDDFGITAHTIEVELPVKLSPAFTLSPFLRFYTQKGTSYFRPYREHALSSTYYTSDYDLSSFESYEGGLEAKFSGLSRNINSLFNKPGLRYSFYKRSDGLYAHTLTFFTEMVFQKKKR